MGLENIQDIVAYCARVSNPSNQANTKTTPKLLEYLIKHKHWSPFEMASACIEITTTRDIARQLLRHRSFSFQEFSQRYADTNLLSAAIPVPDLRSQDTKNRQNSIDDVDPLQKQFLQGRIHQYFIEGMDLYNELLREGIAKECARFVLPLATPTKIYMTGNLRSWMHYITLRTANGTQKEHMEIAELCKQHFVCQFPTISKALDWCSEDCECNDTYRDDLQPCLKIE